MKNQGQPVFHWRSSAIYLLAIPAGLGCLSSALGWLGRLNPNLDLFSHFYMHAVLGLMVLGSLLWWLGGRRIALVCLLVALIDAAILTPHLFENKGIKNGRHISLVCVNLLSSNVHHGAVLDYLAHVDADVMVLLEVHHSWVPDLEVLKETYPHHLVEARGDNFGIALYCKRPAEISLIKMGSHLPTVVATIPALGEGFTVVGSHPPPPVSSMFLTQQRQLTALADYMAGIEGPKILAGDLNNTPWNHRFKQLVTQAGLQSSSATFRGTWPASLGLLGIPLDHVLVSPQIGIRRRQIGPYLGSDHLPVWVELTLGAAN